MKKPLSQFISGKVTKSPEAKDELSIPIFIFSLFMLYTFLEFIFGRTPLIVQVLCIPFDLSQGQGAALYTSTGNMKDIDGRSYATVTIGDREWMAADLSAAKFRDGTPIRQAKDLQDWNRAYINKEPVWIYTEHDTDPTSQFGKIYSYHAVNDPRGLAPEGWQIPDSTAWSTLAAALDLQVTADNFFNSRNGENSAEVLQSNDMGWKAPVSWFQIALPFDVGSNESGFSALPGGFITLIEGLFSKPEILYKGTGVYSGWWSQSGSALIIGDNASDPWFFDYYDEIVMTSKHANLPSGFHVRCTRAVANQ